ncbi:hypothetical protein BZA77DRAFT_321163 [Pyronema omphalodes]|nr:hypothetical protein BZA77DRAFT_321163 [Pyronema omphalodes]
MPANDKHPICPEIKGADSSVTEASLPRTPPFDRLVTPEKDGVIGTVHKVPAASSSASASTSVPASTLASASTSAEITTSIPNIPDNPNNPNISNDRVIIPGNPIIPPRITLTNYLKSELSVDRINDIHIDLWWAGRPGNIHALHAQKMMKRDITISEKIELHLVWFDSTIFIKPLPTWILDYDFYEKHICGDDNLYGLANGWLYSYTKLIRNPSDFHIAMELKLLPEWMKWDTWCVLSWKLQKELAGDSTKLDERYQFGELRLPRLNQIYRFVRWFSVYQNVYRQYDHFFSKNFAWLLLLVVYLSTILSALQVVVSTQSTPPKLMEFSYWFGLVSVALILFFVAIQMLLFLIIFVYHFQATVHNLSDKKIDWRFSSQRMKDFLRGRQITPRERTGSVPRGTWSQ